jgi:NhaA family Na+:H+ antiporter
MIDRVTVPSLAKQILRPFQYFIRKSASGGIFLLICALTALVWANSPWASSSTDLWQTRVSFGFGSFSLAKPLLLWINDGLMAVFFFVVGLEIKREVLIGELSTVRQAALPIAAALGGMIVPAGIYFILNRGTATEGGWSIPMATDIAFALGILALLGDRVPLALKVFLTALAIVDDIGAVLVIALFYTAEISWTSLAIGGVLLVLLMAANSFGIRHPLVYALLGAGLWLAFLKSGVHATAAGVLVAMTIPARSRIDAGEFLYNSRAALEEFEQAGASETDVLTSDEQQAAVQALEDGCEAVATPLQRLEHALHPWVAFAIMPVFALANAGVALGSDFSAALMSSLSVGVMAGLVIGKQVGVTLFAWLAVRSGLAALPDSMTWRQVYGASWLAGIGFTMSLFIASLAFGDSTLLSTAKVGILTASLTAGIGGWIILRWATYNTNPFS